MRAVLRLRLGLGAVGTSILCGALFATLGGRWGYTVTFSVWVVTGALIASILRAGPFRRNLSD